jgi:hypothetical protein
MAREPYHAAADVSTHPAAAPSAEDRAPRPIGGNRAHCTPRR